MEAREKQRQANVEIAKLLAGLESNKEEGDQVEDAIGALGICYQTLGKVASAFQQGEQFWATVNNRAECLAQFETHADMLSKRDLEKVRDVMLESAQAWAAMGLLSHRALGLLQEVNGKAQEMMENLPSGTEARKEIKAEAKALGILIEEENKALSDSPHGGSADVPVVA